MRGDGVCVRDGAVGAAGFTPTGAGGWLGTAGGAAAGGVGVACSTGSTVGRAGAAGATGAAAGACAAGAAGAVNVGRTVGVGNTTFGGGATGTGSATGAAGLTATVGATGLAAAGGTAGGRTGGTVGACCLRMAFRTSPGREICERSILVLISSAATRLGRADFDAADASPAVPRKCARTFSASWSSRELEWVFFSVTPTSVSTSRIALLLTSSSLARSLIRILLIRPFRAPSESR
jgi:hypothetical protein